MDISLFQKFFLKIKVKKYFNTIDFLNGHFSMVVLLTCSILISGKSIVSDSIVCHSTAPIEGPDNKFVDSHCFLTATYFLTDNQQIPKKENRNTMEFISMNFYQYISYFLMVESFAFYLPVLLFKFLIKNYGKYVFLL